jgi:hypothetical protein
VDRLSHFPLEWLKYWLPLAVVITAFSGLAYLSVQQNFRLSANDPQIQMAEDTAQSLLSGNPPENLLPPFKVDISQSLSPFTIIFDKDGRPSTSSAVLDGKTPLPPAGVFADTKNSGETRFTWEPKDGVRSAAVAVYYKGKNEGFVLAGRSLREIEKREDHLMSIVFSAWILSLAATFLLVAFLSVLTLKANPPLNDFPVNFFEHKKA